MSEAIIASVEMTISAETARGEVDKRERASPSVTAQRYQDFTDRLLFAMAGLSEAEARGLEGRLAVMMRRSQRLETATTPPSYIAAVRKRFHPRTVIFRFDSLNSLATSVCVRASDIDRCGYIRLLVASR